jgi:uncharacterized membrane protein YgcG
MGRDVTSRPDPIRQPANDLHAFDVSKRTPEQIALLFARWKEQRKRLNQRDEQPNAEKLPQLRPVPPIMRGKTPVSAIPAQDDPPDEPSDGRGAISTGPVRYSASFTALLESRREPVVPPRIANTDAERPQLRRSDPPRRSKLKWVLACAASGVAVAAVAAGAVWQTSWQAPSGTQASRGIQREASERAVVAEAPPAASADPLQIDPLQIDPLQIDPLQIDPPQIDPPQIDPPQIEPADPLEIDMAEPFVAVATAAPAAAEWPLRQTVDLALMSASAEPAPAEPAPAQFALAPRLKPPVPVVHTAADAQPSPKLEAITTIGIPLDPSVATGAASAQSSTVADDRRPRGFIARGKDRDEAYGGNRTAASAGKASASAGLRDSGNGGTGGAGSGGSGGASGNSGGPGGKPWRR